MILTLEVTSSQASSLGPASRRVFSAEGGTIGRAGSSDWILSHRKVSGRHAVLTYQDGVFYIMDDGSANGVFMNSTNNRLIPSRRYALKSGDRIIIDPYELDVSITDDEVARAGMPDVRTGGPHAGYDPFNSADLFGPARLRTPAPARTPVEASSAGEAVGDEELDPLKLLDGNPPVSVRRRPTARDLDGASPLAGHYQPPPVPLPPPAPAPFAGVSSIPADYDPLRPDNDGEFGAFELDDVSPPVPQAPAPPPVEVPIAKRVTPSVPVPLPPIATAEPRREIQLTPEPPHESDPGLLAVLQGAGLERAPVTLEFARSFGQIFRVVVSGVMDVLRSRQQIKDEFRMRMTQFRPVDNNPLKFSANVDDALHNLLVKRNAAYLEPVEAFEDAFDDLRDHQIAMLAGMRVAFESMLAQFDPLHMQEQFDKQVRRTALTTLVARLRYWELYRERHAEMSKDPDAVFKQLFGDEFAKAYEEQLRRLKAGRRPAEGARRPPDA